jgi:hypothetical protein
MGPLPFIAATAILATFWPNDTGKDRVQKPTARPAAKPKPAQHVQLQAAKPIISAPVEKPSKYSICETPRAAMGVFNNHGYGEVDLFVRLNCSPSTYGSAEQVIFSIHITDVSGREEALREIMFNRHGNSYDEGMSGPVEDIKLPAGKHLAVMTFCVGEHKGTHITDSKGLCVQFEHVDCAKSSVELASVEFTTNK